MLSSTFSCVVVLLLVTLLDAFRAPMKQPKVTAARCQADSSSNNSPFKSAIKKATAAALTSLVFLNQMPVQPAAASVMSSSFQGSEQ
jgi:hypothetical protein